MLSLNSKTPKIAPGRLKVLIGLSNFPTSLAVVNVLLDCLAVSCVSSLLQARESSQVEALKVIVEGDLPGRILRSELLPKDKNSVLCVLSVRSSLP